MAFQRFSMNRLKRAKAYMQRELADFRSACAYSFQYFLGKMEARGGSGNRARVFRERYQTVFAKNPGAIAAPTAGLHFSEEILRQIRARGVEKCELTLNIGLGTFQPVHGDMLEGHVMHSESYEIPREAAEQINAAHAAGRPILAIGTTVVRALEDSALRSAEEGSSNVVKAGKAEARLFITPGFRFRAVTGLLTNFHLPRSTLLALVCAFAGRENVLAAYRHAVETGYRFYSYGDCMLIQ